MIKRLHPERAGTMRGKAWLLAFALAFLTLSEAVRAEPASEENDDQSAATPTPARRKVKDKYKRSKLTRDESEGVADHRRLLLTTGEDKAVDLEFEANAGANGISVGNPQTVGFTLVKAGDKRQIVFKPLKPGETTVTVRDQDGTIRLIFVVRVTPSNLLHTAGELRDLLKDIEGIEIRIVGQKIVIDGEALVPSDYGRMLTVIQDDSYKAVVLNLVTLSPLALQVLSKRMQEDITTFAPNVKTRVVNGLIFLEGTVENIDQARRAENVSKLYLPELKPGPQLEKDPSVQRLPDRRLVWNFIVITPSPPRKAEKLVRVTVHFVELAKDYNSLFGFSWQPGFTSDTKITIGTRPDGSSGSGGFSFAGTISSLFPRLQSAQQAGFARVIKTGTIITRSGQPAKLNEVTQFPFSQQGANGQIVAASVGVGLDVAVTPLILGQSEDIQLDLEMNQTSLVGKAPATGGAPVTSQHKVTTKVYVKSAESAAIAGVNASDIGTDFNKDDPTSQAAQGSDPLFQLVRTKQYRKKKSQFVIFVTPQIIENASQGTEDLKKNFRVKVN